MWISIPRNTPIDHNDRFIPSYLVRIIRYAAKHNKCPFDIHNVPYITFTNQLSFDELENEIQYLTYEDPYKYIPFSGKWVELQQDGKSIHPPTSLPPTRDELCKRFHDLYAALYHSTTDAYYKSNASTTVQPIVYKNTSSGYYSIRILWLIYIILFGMLLINCFRNYTIYNTIVLVVLLILCIGVHFL